MRGYRRPLKGLRNRKTLFVFRRATGAEILKRQYFPFPKRKGKPLRFQGLLPGSGSGALSIGKREARKHEIQSRFYSLQTGWKGLKELGQEEKARKWLIKNAFKGYSVTKEDNG